MDMKNYNESLKKNSLGYWEVNKDSFDISYPAESHENILLTENSSYWFQHRNHCILEAIKKYSPNGVIFDVGGGNGFVSKFLMKYYDIVLVEPGINGVINALKRGVTNVIHSSLQDANFKKESLNAVGLFDVLEHIEDDIKFLKEIHALLENNGRLYITVPAYKILWSVEDDFAGHFRRYTMKQLHEKLRLAGFKINYSSYFFSFLPLPIFMFRTIPSVLGIRKKKSKVSKNEHSLGRLDWLLNQYFRFELKCIEKGRILFGGSCIISAEKYNV